MKFRNLHFLSASNIKGDKNTKMLTALICLLVVAITLISSYSVITISALNSYNDDYKARTLDVSPFMEALTQDMIDEICSVEHVEAVTDVSGMLCYGTPFYIQNTEFLENLDEKGDCEVYIKLGALYEGEKKNIIKGSSLDNAPVFSCLIPSIFYPYDDAYDRNYKNLEYIDGRTLVGQTITVQSFNGDVDFQYYKPNDSGYNEQVCTQLPTPEFTLKVVGVYSCSFADSGGYNQLYVSRETDLLMTRMTMEEAGIDLNSADNDIVHWYNTPSLHDYAVVVDDYSNLSEVYNSVRTMGYNISHLAYRIQDNTVVLLANLFKFVGTFLTVAIAFISVVILVQSSVNTINERKGYIGLMKAIGYKSRQVFLTLLWEQLYLSLRAFLIGGVVSTVLAYLINLYFEHGTYRQLQYVMDWNVYFAFLGLAFLIVLLVPIVTELLLIRKLVKIEPRDAMTVK